MKKENQYQCLSRQRVINVIFSNIPPCRLCGDRQTTFEGVESVISVSVESVTDHVLEVVEAAEVVDVGALGWTLQEVGRQH